MSNTSGFYIEDGSILDYNGPDTDMLVLPPRAFRIVRNPFCRLQKVTRIVANRYFCSVDGVLFSLAKDVLHCYPAGKKEKEYAIPGGVRYIGQAAFANADHLQTVCLPNGMDCIRREAFLKCIHIENIYIPDSVRQIQNNAFLGCKSLKKIVATGCMELEEPLGTNKNPIQITALALPHIGIQKASNRKYKLCLAMGYILHPELYNKRIQAGYEKFVSENRGEILEAAKRYDIKDVVNVLEPGAASDLALVTNCQEQMSRREAGNIFEFTNKISGVKIQRYLGKDKVVCIPRIIGKTAVTLVSNYAFPSDTVVHCSAELYPKLPYEVQLHTLEVYLSNPDQFSQEQGLAIQRHRNTKGLQLLHCAIAQENIVMLKFLLEQPLTLEAYDVLIEAAQNAPTCRMLILTEKRKYFPPERIDEIQQEQVEKNIGIR